MEASVFTRYCVGRCGHLMPGIEEEAAGLLDAYLEGQREQAETVARAAGSESVEALAGGRVSV